ncbi:MAG: NAD(P)/FAD-dependent oxidoreductase [Candidatus Puniceispirillaceae bacterium]
MRIAVIGSGISGLASGFLLRNHADVHLFESAGRIGGHSNTVETNFGGVSVPVDTGFIVYNPLNYPNLMSLFAILSVPHLRTDMSFSVSLGQGELEYEGSIKGLLAQPANLLKKRYWSMLADLMRFYKTAPGRAMDGPANETLGQFVARQGYGSAFIDDHLVPMGAAIWSSSTDSMMNFPVRAFMRFMENHKLLNFIDRPQWRTVAGGSREYVTRIAAHLGDRINLNTNIRHLRRTDSGVMVNIDGQGEIWFDAVVLAAHADQSLALIQDASKDERDILSAFQFQNNCAVLHSDARLMPKRRGAWAAWNYVSTSAPGQPREANLGAVRPNVANDLCLTYWMNRLQSIDLAYPLYETLNPVTMPDKELIHGEFHYRHPVFDNKAIAAQPRLGEIQGKNGLFFAGAWTGFGFHEDGLKSAIAVVKTLGVNIPWPSDVRAYEQKNNPVKGIA